MRDRGRGRRAWLSPPVLTGWNLNSARPGRADGGGRIQRTFTEALLGSLTETAPDKRGMSRSG